jgi:hypothetical protein
LRERIINDEPDRQWYPRRWRRLVPKEGNLELVAPNEPDKSDPDDQYMEPKS